MNDNRITADVANLDIDEVEVYLFDRVTNGKTNSFVESIHRAIRTGYASVKQEMWARILVSEHLNPAAPAAPTAPATAPATTEINVSPLVELLEGAKARGLKFPKVRLENLAFSIAGPRAKAPGTVNVTDGRPFGENAWYGRIERDGTWQMGRNVPAEIVERVTEFAANPAIASADHGHLHGNCCFCTLPLSDERSTHVGYGQKCSKNWGMPYPTAKEYREEVAA